MDAAKHPTRFLVSASLAPSWPSDKSHEGSELGFV